MASFLQARQPSYATRINEKGHRISTLTYPGHPYPPELCAIAARLSEGLGEVALSRGIAVEFISFLVKLTELIEWTATPVDKGAGIQKPDMTMQRAIYDLQCLCALPLTPTEAQIARALLAFCLHLYNQMTFQIPLARPLRPLLEAFNAQIDLPRSPWLQRCLYWCALVTASAWDTQIDASPERHAILDMLMGSLPEARSWEDTRGLMEKFFWVERLADEWEVCWRAAMFRVRRVRRGASQIEGADISRMLSARQSSEEESKTST
jgi:hypothetical protein